MNLRPLGPEPSALAPALLPELTDKNNIYLSRLCQTYAPCFEEKKNAPERPEQIVLIILKSELFVIYSNDPLLRHSDFDFIADQIALVNLHIAFEVVADGRLAYVFHAVLLLDLRRKLEPPVIV